MSVLSLLVTAAPAFASTTVTVTGTNALTGADSTNKNKYDVNESGASMNTNLATAINAAHALINTGHNKQKENTTGGSLDSGNIMGATNWISTVNMGAYLVGHGNILLGGTFSNNTTGHDSWNKNSAHLMLSGDLTLDNIATILNTFELGADSGYNKQKENTTAGDLMTGNIHATSTIANSANNGSYVGNGSAITVNSTSSNQTTGADSTNKNSTSVSDSGNKTTTNIATLTTSSTVSANTGHNKQNENTTAGDLTTGSITTSSTVTNSANNDGSTSHDEGDSTSVTSNFSNNTTGADSTNKNSVDVDKSGNTTETNVATAVTTDSVTADTGHNSQSENTSGGDVSTGDASVNFNVSNNLNNN